MPIGWYIVPYKITQMEQGGPNNKRYCAMDDYTNIIIYQDGGNWSETEVLGNRAIVKVKASLATLTMLNGVFKRVPKDRLDDPLSDLSTEIKQALKNEALDMGYTIEEIQERLPNPIGTYTLRDVLKFYATKRRKPRWNDSTSEIVCDGIDQQCRTIESVDAEVQ